MSNFEAARLQAALHGDPDAFTELVEAYQTPVFNLCYRMLGDPQEAEDAAQETFWRAYQALDRYDRDRSFTTWLLSIAAHYCIDQHRRRKMPTFSIDDAFEEMIADHAPDPESSASRSEEDNRLRTLLKTLTPQDRSAVALKYWYDFSDQEIADALHLTVSAVKSRLFRARQTLARTWQASQPETACAERSCHESPAF